jgi:hypothetical protein
LPEIVYYYQKLAMKKTVVFIALLFGMAQLTTGQTLSYKDLLGKWEGTDEKSQTGALEFLDSSRMAMSMMGSAPRSLMYSIDFAKNPAAMDLYRDASKKGMALKCLIQLIDANTLKWQVFPGGDRPDKFDEDSPGTLIVLKRKK